MGDVVAFRRARLTGFIPENLGAEALEKQHQETRAELAGLVDHAKLGKPAISSLYEPFIERPCDCGPET